MTYNVFGGTSNLAQLIDYANLNSFYKDIAGKKINAEWYVLLKCMARSARNI